MYDTHRHLAFKVAAVELSDPHMLPSSLSLTTKFSCFFIRFFSNHSRFGRICLVNAVIQNWLILQQFFSCESLTFLKTFHLS